MPASTPRAVLQLQLVPAGRRLDFDLAPDHHAHVYRRSAYQPWECIAYNAHSPFVDRAALPVGAPTEYVVIYYDPAGQVTVATPIAQVGAALLPAAPCVLALR
ncbi:hypothetical protein EJV47_21050 [Hymenobacter gummosus]|uniref:Uncharacterized protein n=1 Tax=Hymenobacter gummosus TaxID=1776032 RepID=A0A431TXP4_9BACT|nr:hypothetical protein [Hymenobacter gummosus]RTQ46861.1 hypothetical protein EJV47_21050 [Hymenobacter gummosus]